MDNPKIELCAIVLQKKVKMNNSDAQIMNGFLEQKMFNILNFTKIMKTDIDKMFC